MKGRMQKRGIERDILVLLIVMLLTLAVLITVTVVFRGRFPSFGVLP